MLLKLNIIRCKLVCKSWHRSIQRHVERPPGARLELQERWAKQECSRYPLHPSMYGPCPDLQALNGDSYYRFDLAAMELSS